jgi:paired amphipathic helix protein Sin3a
VRFFMGSKYRSRTFGESRVHVRTLLYEFKFVTPHLVSMDAAPTTPALPVLPTDMSTADVQMKDETTVEDKVTEDVQLTETSESGAGEVPGHETTPNPDGPCPSEEVPMAIIAPDNGKEVQKSNSDPLPDVNRPQETVIITRDISIPPISRPQSPSMPPPSRPASRLPPMGSFQVPSQPLLERPLNVTDALGYLDAVKVQFHDQPDVYNHFLDIMKDFKSGLCVLPLILKHIPHLFTASIPQAL